MSRTAAAGNRLVSTDDLKGARVFGADGSDIASIHHLMVDREVGQVVYAVIEFHSAAQYPVPWRALRYNSERSGYDSKITPDTLRGAPSYSDASFGNREWERSVFRHYGARPY